jgi:hypothetical protein
MISRTATRTKISPVRQGRSNPYRRKTSAIDHAVRVVHSVCCLSGAASLIDDIRTDLRAEGIPRAIRRHDTATLFDWLISALSYQGISDQVAADYMERHGRARWADIDAKVAAAPTCPKLLALLRLPVRQDQPDMFRAGPHRRLSPADPSVAQRSAQPDGLLVILVRSRHCRRRPGRLDRPAIPKCR